MTKSISITKQQLTLQPEVKPKFYSLRRFILSALQHIPCQEDKMKSAGTKAACKMLVKLTQRVGGCERRVRVMRLGVMNFRLFISSILMSREVDNLVILIKDKDYKSINSE